MTPTVKMVLIFALGFILARSLEQLLSNYGFDPTAWVPRPGSATAATVPTASGEAG